MTAQPTLFNERHRPGTVERHAVADLTELRQLERLPAGSLAVQDAYKQVAREIDRAEKERDRWGKIRAVSELVKIRLALAPEVADGTTEGLDDWIAGLPTAAAGDTPPA